MAENTSIQSLPEEDRPREKMQKKGISALSTAELLAIIIGSGSRNESAVELMRRILTDCENRLSRLAKCDMEELCRYKGIGTAKAIALMAVSELGKRRQEEPVADRVRISSAEDVYRHFHPHMRDLPVEECRILLLNQGAYVIDESKVSQGGLTATQVDIRCILREALIKRATALILCHNHPSGNSKPSRDDDRLTHSLKEAAQLMNIQLLDHVIVCEDGYYSYRDDGKL